MLTSIIRRTLQAFPLFAAIATMLVCFPFPADSLAEGLKNEARSTEESTSEIEFADAGMTGEHTWESPQYGFALEWGRDWELDTYNYDVPVESRPDAGIDTIALIWLDGDGGFGRVRIHGALPDAEDEAAWVEFNQDSEFIAENWEENYEVEPILDHADDDSGHVVYEIVDTADSDAVYYSIFETVELEDGTWVYFTLTSSGEAFETAFDRTAEDLELDGESVFLTDLTWDEIEAAASEL